MMKSCTGFLLATLSMTSLGGEYDSYYKMIRDSSSAWVNGWGWPNNTAPRDDQKCYVPSQYMLTLNGSDAGKDFVGAELAIAGTFYFYGGSWGASMTNTKQLSLLPGGVWMFGSFAGHFNSPLEILGTRESPSLFRYVSEDNRNYTIYPDFTYTSGPDGFMRFCVVPDNISGLLQYDFSKANFSGFQGTLQFDDPGASFVASATIVPGTLEVVNGASAYLTHTSWNSTFGTFRLGAGSSLNLAPNGTAALIVTNGLDLASGSVLKLKKIDTFAIPTHETSPYRVFRLSPAAVADGLPDFSSVVVDFGYQVPIDANRTGSEKIGLPTAAVVQSAQADGSVDLALQPRPVVKFTKGCGWSATPFKEGFDCTGYLSDDKPFHADADYYADGAYNIYVQDVGATTVFPGHSMTFKGTGVGFYDGYDFPDLRVCSGTDFRLARQATSWPGTFTLAGNVKVLERGWSTSGCAWSLSARNNNNWIVLANISGHDKISFRYNPSSDDKRERWSAWTELDGDNSAFAGTMSVDFDPQGLTPDIFEKNGWETFVSSFASNMTLIVHNKANLGGALAAFDPAALTISDWCRLSFAETATFDEMTRGWTFPAHAALAVVGGATATVRQTITCGDGAQLVKEGKGTLVLGGAINAGATAPTLTVSDGALGFAAADALANIGVTFAAGTALAVDATTADPDLKARGLTVGSGTFPGSDKVPVAFDVGELGSDDSLSVGVMTLADDVIADAMLARLKFKHVSRHRVTVTKVANGDGTVTLKADIEPTGFAIILR